MNITQQPNEDITILSLIEKIDSILLSLEKTNDKMLLSQYRMFATMCNNLAEREMYDVNFEQKQVIFKPQFI